VSKVGKSVVKVQKKVLKSVGKVAKKTVKAVGKVSVKAFKNLTIPGLIYSKLTKMGKKKDGGGEEAAPVAPIEEIPPDDMQEPSAEDTQGAEDQESAADFETSEAAPVESYAPTEGEGIVESTYQPPEPASWETPADETEAPAKEEQAESDFTAEPAEAEGYPMETITPEVVEPEVIPPEESAAEVPAPEISPEDVLNGLAGYAVNQMELGVLPAALIMAGAKSAPKFLKNLFGKKKKKAAPQQAPKKAPPISPVAFKGGAVPAWVIPAALGVGAIVLISSMSGGGSERSHVTIVK
jgi:hypothetical protein